MYYNQNQGLINQLERQKDNIDNLLYQYSQPTPVQNIINTGSDFEARFINENEDISNIPIMKKTLFIDEYNKKISIKELDGSISKEYEIVVPLDEKDKKILELETKLKEMEMKYESTKPIKSNDECKESNANDDANANASTKTNV
jgi:hypothetical protein